MEQYLAGVKDRSILESGSIDAAGINYSMATLNDFGKRGVKNLPDRTYLMLQNALEKYYPKIDNVNGIIVNKSPKNSNIAYWLLCWVAPHWKVVELVIDSRSNKVIDHRIVDI